MRVAVVGNCHGSSVATCAQAMSPGLDAKFISWTDVTNGTYDLKSILQNHDFTFGQPYLIHHLPEGFESRVLYFPVIVFPAYHPDMVYVRGKRKGGNGSLETVTNIMVMYHSKIALAGYVQGLDVDQVVALYKPESFSRLGFFDAWAPARDELLKEGGWAGMPLSAHIDSWARRGCFMHSMNHPQLHVMADLTRHILKRARIPVENQNVVNHLDDPLKLMSVWPVYPPIAERLNLYGDYQFVLPMNQGTISLKEFIEDSFTQFSQFETGSLEFIDSSLDDVRARLGFVAPSEPPAPRSTGNPYKTARAEQFWKRSVANVAMESVDPVVEPRFLVDKSDRIATAGSCFAQHIARRLASSGYDYFVAETPPADLKPEDASARNYDVYSARYGNIYTVRQLRQLIERVEGDFSPCEDFWARPDGRLVDPFRPQIEPAGFGDLTELHASRAVHFEAVRRMLRDMNVFVFTLGLTEGWRSKLDGAVFPLAPGVAGGECDFERHEFVNFGVDETVDDLQRMLDRLSVINPNCRVILTVSPVPLIATYEPRHALVATTYSKAVLRAAADAVRRSRQHVEYFPSYEIVTGAHVGSKYFEDDLRSVTPDGVAHVMKIFMSRFVTSASDGIQSSPPPSVSTDAVPERKSSLFDVVCDEEAIANF